MKPSQVQAFFREQLAASAALVAYMPVITVQQLADEEAVNRDVDAALKARGACLVVGEIPSTVNDRSEAGSSVARTVCPVFVVESYTVDHVLREQQLVEAVVGAITRRATDTFPGRRTPAWERTESGLDEQGYLVHVVIFSMPVQLP